MGHMIEKKKSSKETKVFIDEFNGRPMFAVWEVDPAGNKAKQVPIVSFGKAKAEAILKHIDDLKDFLEAVQ